MDRVENPRPDKRAAARRFHEAATPGVRTTRRQGVAPRVLVVDDSAELRAIYEESLSSLGYEVACAASGEEALHAVREERPAVIVMDVSMGDMDGIEALRLLKADGATRRCPVIIATAHGDSSFDAARHAGCDAFLCKPVDPFTLDELIGALLEPARRVPTLERVSGFDCARALALVGFRVIAAEAPYATLERGSTTLYVPLVPQLSPETLDGILGATDMPRERFAELLERFVG